MRPIRLLLACLLSLGVAFQGYAGTLAMEADCPMAQAAEHARHLPAAAAHDPALMHDMHGAAQADGQHPVADPAQEHCPTDEPAPAQSGTGHCACVLGCQPANSMTLGMAAPPAALPLLRQAPPPLLSAFRSHTALGHWRPPALI